MKKIFLVICMFVVSIVIFAQKTSNDGFNAFWKKFKTALAKNDKVTVIKLTQFPFHSDIEPRGINTQKDLLKIYDDCFDKETKKVLLTKKPIESNGDYIIEDGYLIYTFRNTENGWKFVEIVEWDD